MKSKLTQLLLAAAILGGAISMTSCQGLIDAVLGDHGDNPTTTPTPTPTPTPPTYANGTERPLTFEAAADGVTVTFKFKDGALPDYKKVEYSLDGGATWTALSSPAQPILLKKTGDIVMFRGDNPTYNGDARFVVEQAASQTRATTRVLDKKMLVYLYGNLASLIENRDIYGAVQLKENNRAAFKDLFKDALIDHEIENERGDKVYELILPSIDKSITVPEAFMSLFENTPITHAPVVRVYTISPGTMSNMFYDCPRLSYATFELGAIEDDIKALEEAMGGMLGGTTGTEAEGFFNIGWALDPELENNGDWNDPQPITLDEMTKASGISQDVLDNTIITIINENGKASEAAPFISVTGVEITGSGNGLELIAGENCNLSAKVVPEDASDKSISWSSEDKTIATVDDKGCVTAVSSGTTTIRASHNPYSATITVTVKAAASGVLEDYNRNNTTEL